MKTVLSIVIPVYNVEEYLHQCLTSVVESMLEKGEETEVIIIDDGSQDNSGKIADAYAKKYPQFRVIHQPNSGVASARNRGISEAKGEWIYFVDSDDWLTANAISSIHEALLQHTDADLLLFDAYKYSFEKYVAWEHFLEEKSWKKDWIEGKEELRRLQGEVLYTRKTPLAAPWDKVYRTRLLKEKKLLFQENLEVLDDMVFNMEVVGAADRIVYLKEKIYCYRYVPDSITNRYRPDRVRQDMAVWNYIKKYIDDTFEEEDEQVREEFWQSFYCRVIKSFSICCRLCFFHDKNEDSLKDRLIYVKKVMQEPVYQEAFEKVKKKRLEWKLRLVWFMVRQNCAKGIYLLHLANKWREGRNEG